MNDSNENTLQPIHGVSAAERNDLPISITSEVGQVVSIPMCGSSAPLTGNVTTGSEPTQQLQDQKAGSVPWGSGTPRQSDARLARQKAFMDEIKAMPDEMTLEIIRMFNPRVWWALQYKAILWQI